MAHWTPAANWSKRTQPLHNPSHQCLAMVQNTAGIIQRFLLKCQDGWIHLLLLFSRQGKHTILPACSAYVLGKLNIRVSLPQCQSYNQIFLNVTSECWYNFQLNISLARRIIRVICFILIQTPYLPSCVLVLANSSPHKAECCCIYIYVCP